MTVGDQPVGLFHRGTVHYYDASTGKMKVKLNSSAPSVAQKIIEVESPYPLTTNNGSGPGLFIGAKVKEGTPVLVSQAMSNKYYFVNFYAENGVQIPTSHLKDDEILIFGSEKAKITLNRADDTIYLGSKIKNINLDNKKNILTFKVDNEYHFTEASRSFNGAIMRENGPQKNKSANNIDLETRLDNNLYEYKVVGLNPNLMHSPNNPAFVENREIIYELENLAEVKSDQEEASLKKGIPSGTENYIYPSRRLTKSDALSLTLKYPNYLIETIKGTVVDIFGNILDINRFPVENDKSEDKSDTFLKIKEAQRKSVAYHFEINSRKDFSKSSQSGNDLFNYDAKHPDADYGRFRSRFFFDIDKEGQFKLNVPSSSEKGNIPLLTRYENYTNFSTEDNNNPNKILSSPEGRLIDILQDSFACPKLDLNSLTYADSPGSIKIEKSGGEGAPKDRIYGSHIKHGTVFHDILATCYAHQKNDFIQYPYDDATLSYLNSIPLLKDVVSDTVKISGDDANAGGRSGILNFDGSIELNIGANTVDRQSMWLDTAGGLVANIGREKTQMVKWVPY